MLLARSASRVEETADASTILTPTQIQILRFRFEDKEPLVTAKQAAFAVAKLGGHLRRNGLPGWQTLARGFEALFLMQVGWRAAIASAASASDDEGSAERCE